MSDLMDIIHDEPEKKRFEITDVDSANWAVGRMLTAETRIQQYRALADSYKRKIDEWLDRATKDDMATIEHFEHELRPFAELEIAKTKKQSMKLLGATVGFRKTPASVQIDDEEEAISYCETFAPELVRTKKSLDKTELRKRLEKGEEIDGARVEPGSVRFYVNLEEGDE